MNDQLFGEVCLESPHPALQGCRATDVDAELRARAGRYREATVTLSSDWDAGPLPPLGTIERSLTRDANAVPDLTTALEMHTIDAAYAGFEERDRGSIEPGKVADFAVLADDPTRVAPESIGDIEVKEVFVAGVVA